MRIPASRSVPLAAPDSGRTVCAVTAVVVALIWLVGLHVPSHRPLQPPLEVPFPATADAWRVTGSPSAASVGDGVTLRGDAARVNRVAFAVPLARPSADRAWLRVSGRVVEAGPDGRAGSSGGVGLLFVSSSGDVVGRHNLHYVPRRAGASERFSDVAEWPLEAVEARVSLRAAPGAPTFTVHEGAVELVEPAPSHAVALGSLVVPVAAWLVVLYRFAAARAVRTALVLPAAVALLIVVGVTLSSWSLRPLVAPLMLVAEARFGIERAVTSVALLKGGHAFGFFLLTLCLLALRERLGASRLALAAFATLLAIGSEGLQVHVAGRDASLADVVVDVAGVAAALLASSLASAARRRRRRDARRLDASARTR